MDIDWSFLVVKQLPGGIARGQMEAHTLRYRPWDASTHFIQPFENSFLSRNLVQNMAKNVYFFGGKSIMGSPPNLHWFLPPDPQCCSSPYSFVECGSSIEHISLL